MHNIMYVICVVDENYDFVRYAYGGGSSSKSYIRAFEDESSAVRTKTSLRKHSLGEGESFMVLPYKETYI